MKGEMWREDGYHGSVYVVFPKNTKAEDAIKEAATVRHMKKDDLKAVIGWTYKGSLYIGEVAPAEKATKKTVVIKRG